MPFIRKNEAKRDPKAIDIKTLFVGRTEELHFFVDHFLAPETPSYNILSLSGQGGIGKSTLLSRFIEETRTANFKDYCLTAITDERLITPTNIMESFARQLHITGKFEKALIRYKDALHRLQAQHEMRMPDRLGSVAKAVPLVGGILEGGVGAATAYLFDEVRSRQLLKDAEQLQDPYGDLTHTFVSELNILASRQVVLTRDRSRRNQRIILFFDTFEQSAPDIAPWLLDYFLEQDIDANIVLVVSGRVSLEHSVSDLTKRWLSYYNADVIYSMQLGTFTQVETSAYLMKRGIIDPIEVETVWRLSHGLPLYLSLLTSHPHVQIDPTESVVANFLRWIPEQEHIQRQLALDAALFSRPFNQDDLQAFSYLPQSDNDRFALYSWLISLPFIRASEHEGRYCYHELARQLFSQYLFQRPKKEYYATRKAIATYYKAELEKTQLQREQTRSFSGEWIVLVFGLVLQLFALPDEKSWIEAIEYVLYAYESSQAEVESNIHVLKQEILDNAIGIQELPAKILEQLSAYIETDLLSQPEDVVAVADNLLATATHQLSFSAKVQASILCRRGLAFQNLGEYQCALDDFNQMIHLDPDTADYYNYRGNIHYSLKDYQRAILDFQQALQLNPKLAVAYQGLILAQKCI